MGLLFGRTALRALKRTFRAAITQQRRLLQISEEQHAQAIPRKGKFDASYPLQRKWVYMTHLIIHTLALLSLLK